MGLSVELQQQLEKHPSFTHHLIDLSYKSDVTDMKRKASNEQN